MRTRIRTRLVAFAVIVLSAAGMMAGAIMTVIWWQNRPLAQAEDLLQEGEASLALSLITDYLEAHPQHAHAVGLKARALVALGRSTEAIRLFERVGAATPQELHALAQALLQRKLWSRARPVLEHLLRHDPRNPDLLHEISACRAYLRDSREAIASAETLATVPGHEARGHLLAGTIHQTIGNSRSAVEAWKKVLEHSPDAQELQVSPAEFFQQYAAALVALGRAREALPLLERRINEQPTAAAYALTGTARRQLGETTPAVEAWKHALELDSGNREARLGLAQWALERGQPGETLEWLQPIESDPDLTSQVAYLIERAHSMLGNTAAVTWRQRKQEIQEREALQGVLDQLLIQSPHSSWARAVLAWRFAEAGNWEQAQVIVEQLRRQDPHEPFLRDLWEAIRTRGSLPSLDRVPVQN